MTFNTFGKKSCLAAAAVAALMLAACGGDGDDPAPAPNPVPPMPMPTPTPNPTPTPTPPVARDRIEPFDLVPKAAQAAPAPASRRLPAQASAAQVAQVALGPLEHAKSEAVLNQEAGPGARVQIGLARPVAATQAVSDLAGLLNWTATAEGTQVAAARFVSEGARGVRLGLKVQQLPANATLRFYGDGREVVAVSAQKVLDTLALNRQSGATGDEADTYWSPDFDGAATTLEIELPASANPADVQLAVPALMHNVIDPLRMQDLALKGVGDSESCNLNVTCNSDLLNTESRAEAQMAFISDNKGYVCSGTLMNDAKNSGTPYFLSANHCFSTQTVASTLQTRWFFRAASCGSATSTYSGMQRLTDGARLLYTSAATDTAFMQLNSQPPAGVRYAGSYFGGVVGTDTAVTGVHHPSGDLQKYSEGVVFAYAQLVRTSEGNALSRSDTPQSFLLATWQRGTTEGGSSGSGLFRKMGNNRYVVGQLYGGNASCSNTGGYDPYGRFDLAYNAGIRRWLNP